jgi:hypothetical protein
MGSVDDYNSDDLGDANFMAQGSVDDSMYLENDLMRSARGSI